MNYKRILAGVLASTMVIGSSFAVWAAEGGGTGSGSLDVVEQSDVFTVDLPTDAGTTFDYILDPTGVIKETEAAKYEGATFADGATVYFANVSESGKSYSATSDAVKAVNKSTMDVTIKVNARVAAVDGIQMATSSTFADDAEDAAVPQLYLALKDSDTNNSDEAITADGIEVTSTIEKLDGAYVTKYVDGKYVKQLKDDVDEDTFKTYSFQLTGACNQKGNWAGLKNTPPAVELVWSIEDPTVTGPQATLSATGLLTISGLTAELNLAETADNIKIGVGDTLYNMNIDAVTLGTDNWTQANGGTLTVQMNKPYGDAYNGQLVQVEVKLSDGTVINCSNTVNIAG